MSSGAGGPAEGSGGGGPSAGSMSTSPAIPSGSREQKQRVPREGTAYRPQLRESTVVTCTLRCYQWLAPPLPCTAFSDLAPEKCKAHSARCLIWVREELLPGPTRGSALLSATPCWCPVLRSLPSAASWGVGRAARWKCSAARLSNGTQRNTQWLPPL